jgi:hypothetical protein
VDRALIKNFFTPRAVLWPIVPAVCVGKSDKDRLASTDRTHYVLPPFKEDEGAVKAVHGRIGEVRDGGHTSRRRANKSTIIPLTQTRLTRRNRPDAPLAGSTFSRRLRGTFRTPQDALKRPRDATGLRRGRLGELKTQTTRMGQ